MLDAIIVAPSKMTMTLIDILLCSASLFRRLFLVAGGGNFRNFDFLLSFLIKVLKPRFDHPSKQNPHFEHEAINRYYLIIMASQGQLRT